MTYGRVASFHLKLLACAVLAIAAIPREARAQDVDACIKASESGKTLRKKQDLIAARAAWSECAASTCPEEVSAYCGSRLTDVVKAIPSIVLAAKDGAGRDVVGVKLTIDGTAYGGHPDGSAIELNPGKHSFLLEAAGQEPVTRDFILNEGERDRRETIIIGAAPSEDRGEVRQASNGGHIQKTFAFVVAGAGLASLLAGGAFGLMSISAHNGYEQNCGSNVGAPPGQCNPAGVNGERDAAAKGNLATGFLIGGAALVATGTMWFFLAPAGHNRLSAGIGPLAVILQGRF
jgi:hypothetical protein